MKKLAATVVSHSIPIERRGQQIFFQINLPLDIDRIVGIETAIRIVDGIKIQYYKSMGAGTLWLQSEGKADVCYCLYVLPERMSMTTTDLGYTAIQAGFREGGRILGDAIAQSAGWKPDPIDLPGCRMFYGSYIDALGIQSSTDVIYHLSIHIWVTLKNRKNE